MTRNLAAFAVSTGITFAALSLAPAAHSATTVATSITCTSGTLSATNNDFNATIGDVIEITNSTTGTVARASYGGLSGTGFIIGVGSTVTFTVTAPGGHVEYGPQSGSDPCGGQTVRISFTRGGGGGGSSSDSASSSVPTPIVQQFGKPVGGTCDVIAPESLNWSGVASGGWGESWAQWMNGGKGGAVCTRMLVHSSSRGAWTVG